MAKDSMERKFREPQLPTFELRAELGEGMLDLIAHGAVLLPFGVAAIGLVG